MKRKRRLRVMPVALLAFTIFLLFVCLVVIFRVNREITYPLEYRDIVERVSEEEGIPEHILYAVIYVESSFDADAVSSAGAVGLMQLLPDTAEWLTGRDGVEYSEEMLIDPEFSIRYGAKFLKILYERYENWDAAHAAYHAGFGRVDSWLENSIARYEDGQLVGIPIAQTETYVNRVGEIREKYNKQLEKEKEEKQNEK